MNAETKIKLIRKMISEMYEAEVEDRTGILFAVETIAFYEDDNEES